MTPPIEQQIQELSGAGWHRRNVTTWIDPEGRLFIGPHGAWKELKRRQEADYLRVMAELEKQEAQSRCR